MDKPITIESLFGVLPTPSHYASYECMCCFAETDNDPLTKYNCAKCPRNPYSNKCLSREDQ